MKSPSVKWLVQTLFVCCALTLPWQCAQSQGQFLLSEMAPHDVALLGTQPARVAPGQQRWRIGAVADFWQASTMFNSRELQQLVYDDVHYDEAEVDVLIERANPGNNHVGLGFSLAPLHLAWQPKPDEDWLLSFSWQERAGAHIRYKRELLELVLRGNAEFLGEELSVGPLQASALYLRSFNVGWHWRAFERLGSLGSLDIAIRPGFHLGVFGANSQNARADFSFAPDASRIAVDFDYRLEFSDPADFRLPSAHGYGAGVDLGANWSFPRGTQLQLNLLDMGGLFFSKNVRGYEQTGLKEFSGLDFNTIFDPETTEIIDNPDFDTDTLTSGLSPDASDLRFSMPLPMRLHLGFSQRVQTGATDWRFSRFAAHYTQGFVESAWSTRRPQLTLVYSQDFTRWLTGGVQLSFGGMNSVGGGIGLSGHWGPAAVHLMLPNLSGVFRTDVATGFATQLGATVAW